MCLYIEEHGFLDPIAVCETFLDILFDKKSKMAVTESDCLGRTHILRVCFFRFSYVVMSHIDGIRSGIESTSVGSVDGSQGSLEMR